MVWWGWLVLGAILFGAELLIIDVQFYLVFIGLSAAIVGILEPLGIVLPLWGQWVLFAVLCLISMVTFRRSLYQKLRKGAVGFESISPGETIRVSSEIAPGEKGRVEYRGSQWSARNVGDAAIAAGSTASVVSVDGVTLNIQ